MDKHQLDREIEHHDEWAQDIDLGEVIVDEFSQACTAPENRFIMNNMGDIRGLEILELGCGAGEASVHFAKRGGNVMATDVSGGMLRVAERLAKSHGVEIRTTNCSADATPFPDETFDIVYAANVLHHVDIENCLLEVRRVLKPGGKFYSWDPLAHNPIINIYRRIATNVRSEDEHPLRMKDLRLFRKYFRDIQYRGTWLFTLWIFMRFYLVERIDPNKDRYWKKIIREHKRLEKTYCRLERLDRFLLAVVPFLTRYCWNITQISRK